MANPYDRIADADGRLAARSALGGLSLTADLDLGSAALTSITAWRWWDWRPANDRDYTSLDILRQSANPVQQDQYSQEIRLGSLDPRTLLLAVAAAILLFVLKLSVIATLMLCALGGAGLRLAGL